MFHVRCKTGLWRCLWDRGWSIPPQWWSLFRFRGTLHVSFQLYLTLCDPIDCSPPGSSVHGILQARVLEWVVIHFSRGSSWPRDQTPVSHIASKFFTIWATRETQRNLQRCNFQSGSLRVISVPSFQGNWLTCYSSGSFTLKTEKWAYFFLTACSCLDKPASHKVASSWKCQFQ